MRRDVAALARRRVVAFGVVAVLGLAAGGLQAAPVVAGATTFRFADVDRARDILTREDDWIAATSEFQRQAILHTAEPVSRASFAAFHAQVVRAWPADAEARWTKALEAVAPRLVELGVPMPAEIWLVDSDGRESAGAPYTRANAVVLPVESLGDPAASPYSDAELLAHEIFHVVSRHAPDLATRLYAVIGFEPVAELAWPSAWLPRRIANPDAPFDRHAMRLAGDDSGGGGTLVMPLLVARRTDLHPGESFFSVLDVRLVTVARSADGRTLPLMQGAEPLWRPAQATPKFLERLGGNTDYIFDPEETMADNFAYLVVRRAVKNPALLERIAAQLPGGR